MVRILEFEGPGQTLFLFERNALRVLSANGGEALIPLRDCLALLTRLSFPPSPDAASIRRVPLQAEMDDGIPGISISGGASLLVFESDSVLLLGAEATEARFPLEDLHALLDYLADTPLISSQRGLRRMMTAQTLPSDVPLLAPSEWVVFRAVQEAGLPLTPSQIAGRCPSLVASSVLGIVERLVGRHLLSAQGAGWVAAHVDMSALVDRMLDHWVASHALGSPEQLSELVRLLDQRIGREVPPH